jgi:arsenate reductase
MKYLFVCYPRCSTCSKAKKFLSENGIEFEERNIKEENPTKEELKEWLDKSDYPIKRFFNTSGQIYREMNLKDKLEEMTEEGKLELLSKDGMLVKRPILVGEDKVLVAFKENEWNVLNEV